jgi:hypothetical protein
LITDIPIVYQGKWRGGYVAVKVLISTLNERELAEFEAEAALMKYDLATVNC